MVLLQSLEQGEALALPDDILEQSTLPALTLTLTLAVLDELAEALSPGSLPLPTPGGGTLATTPGPLVVYEGLTWAFFAEGEAIGRKWRGGP